jgi:hypothetical protein
MPGRLSKRRTEDEIPRLVAQKRERLAGASELRRGAAVAAILCRRFVLADDEAAGVSSHAVASHRVPATAEWRKATAFLEAV